MPHIHHVALWVADIEIVCAFYREAFGVRIGPLYENPKKGFRSRLLTFGAGASIEVMSSSMPPLAGSEAGERTMGLAHLAVSVGSEAAVDELTSALGARGVRILDGPRRTGDGYYESVILDPEGNRVEITA